MQDLNAQFVRLGEYVQRLERKIDALLVARTEKEWYSTEEVALLVRRAPWTVREWCRHGRVRAKKLAGTDKWSIGHEELRRLQAEGLRPQE